MIPDIYSLLRGVPAIVALVGERIYRDEAPQDVRAPYVRWSMLVAVPENHLNGTPPVDSVEMQIECWWEDQAGVERLAVLVRDAVETVGYVLSIAPDDKDTVSKRYRIGITASIWLDRL